MDRPRCSECSRVLEGRYFVDVYGATPQTGDKLCVDCLKFRLELLDIDPRLEPGGPGSAVPLICLICGDRLYIRVGDHPDACPGCKTPFDVAYEGCARTNVDPDYDPA